MHAIDVQGDGEEPPDNSQSGLVSIVVPMYRVESYIEECIRSLCAQTYRQIEIILVDDGSPDRSAEIAERIAREDSRISLIRQRNGGVSSARNAGIDVSRGAYVCFVDGDDTLCPGFVKNMLWAANRFGADFVLSTRVVRGRRKCSGSLPHARVWSSARAVEELLYPRIPIGAWNKLYRRDLLEKNGLRFDSRFAMGEGLIFITKAATVAQLIVATDGADYCYRRDNRQSVTSTRSIAKMRNALEAIDSIDIRALPVAPEVRLARDFQRWMTCFEGAAVASYGRLSTQMNSIDADRFRSYCLRIVEDDGCRMACRTRLRARMRLKAVIIWLSPRFAIWTLGAMRGARRLWR